MSSRTVASPARSAALAFLLAALLAGPALAQSWRFAYMSDHRSSQGHHPGVSTTTVCRIVADMRTNCIDLVLIGGDLIHGDNQPTSDLITQYEVFKGCLAPLTNMGIPYYAIPGNHEFWSENSSWSQATDAWWQAFGQFLPQNGPTSPCPERGMTYSFNHKSALFLGVNMYTNDPTSWFYKGADTNWVQTQLASNTKPHVFAFGHVPQTLIASNDATVQTTVDLWNLLAGAHCCAYFCGHKHSYQRTLTRAPNGAGYIHEVMDGSGMDVINSNGPPWWGAGNPIAVEYLCSDDTMRGYVLVDVDGLNVSVTRRCFSTNAAGEVHWTNMDSFAYTADPGTNWSFAVFGDTRGDGENTPFHKYINTPVIEAICAAITNDGALCAIVPGDLIYGPHPPLFEKTVGEALIQWTNAVAALGRAGIPYYVVRGNHEIKKKADSTAPHADWTAHIGQYMPTNGPVGEAGMTYSLPVANALFVGLDTYGGTNDVEYLHLVNQDWLDTQLAANTRPHLFVFGHEPAFQLNDGIACLSEHLPERNRFWDSIGNANARAYLTGHSHVYGRCLVSISNGPAFRQIIVGTSGGPLGYTWDGQYVTDGGGAAIVPEKDYTPANTYGYTLVRVSGNHVVMEYKSTTNLITWTTNDVFAYTIVSAPTNVHASDGDYTDKVLVSWSPAADAIGYEVWRGTNPATTSRILIATVTTNSTYSDTTAAPVVHYYYWVRGTNADGASPYSSFDTGWRKSSSGLTDFDGDGKTDVTVYQRSTGLWQVLLSGSGYAQAGAMLGGSGAIPVSGDFDGDGKTDMAVYQESTGLWNVLLSGSGYAPAGAALGGVGSVPVAGDFDGDGKTDLAVYQESTGLWNVLLSGSGYAPAGAALGGVGSVPVAGDFDGDGKTDVTVYQESTGLWNVLLSGSGYAPAGAALGGVGSVPVAGDFDGDGKTDLAVYQESEGFWSVLFSGSGYALATTLLGGGGSVPAAGDFDGDGKTDVTVYQESTGLWTVLLSGSGYAPAGAALGGPGYSPVP